MPLKRIVLLVLAFGLASTLLADTIRYDYDAAGRLVRVDFGNGKGVTYTWDANGNLLSRRMVDTNTRRRAVRTAARDSRDGAGRAPARGAAAPPAATQPAPAGMKK